MDAKTLLILALCGSGAALAQPAPFPPAPPTMQEAESAGLKRVSVEELKQYLPGKVVARDMRGTLRRKVFHPDGKGEFKAGGAGPDHLVTWRLSTDGGGYCTRLGIKRGEVCFAVFRAGDGLHFFDYDLNDSQLYWVWRPAGP